MTDCITRELRIVIYLTQHLLVIIKIKFTYMALDKVILLTVASSEPVAKASPLG